MGVPVIILGNRQGVSHSPHFKDDQTRIQLKASQSSSRVKTQPKYPDSQFGAVEMTPRFL